MCELEKLHCLGVLVLFLDTLVSWSSFSLLLSLKGPWRQGCSYDGSRGDGQTLVPQELFLRHCRSFTVGGAAVVPRPAEPVSWVSLDIRAIGPEGPKPDSEEGGCGGRLLDACTAGGFCL